MAESDSDTTLGLEQTPLCRQRQSSTELKQKMKSDTSSRQHRYDDDSPETKWSATPNVAIRRYSILFSIFFLYGIEEKEKREKEKATDAIQIGRAHV